MESKSDRPLNAVPRLHVLPKNAQRRPSENRRCRYQRFGHGWLVAAVWVWQIVA